MSTTYDEYRPVVADRTRWTLPEALRRAAGSHGDRAYLEAPSEGTTLTFAQALEAAERVAAGLLARGHEPGDRLVILSPNRVDVVLAWFGSSLAGIVEVPVNTAYRGTFLDHQVRTVQPSAVVVHADLVDALVECRDACATVRRTYVLGAEGPEVDRALAALADHGFEAEPFAHLAAADRGALPVVRPQDLAAVMFTSGTTGLSKGVVMPHAQMHLFADQCVSLTRLTAEDTYLSVGPLFHGNAQFLAAYPSLLVGARFVLRERFSASRWRRWAEESGATVTNLIGVMSDFVWKQPPSPDDRRHRLRCLFAVPTPTAIVEPWKERFGDVTFVENFGQTEVAMPILSPYGVPRPPGAAGRLVEELFDVRLVDPETDEEVAVGEVGEMVVRPKLPWTVCGGYYAMPDRTSEAVRNCWFRTGDGLRRDADGWYYFADRLKDAIRRRGENISSYEVEQAILTHPDVAECAVVGVPADEDAGEDEVMAVVVAAPGTTLTEAAFWEHCDRSLPYFAVPRYLRLVDALPKTPTEKVRKAELRAAAADGAIDRTTGPGPDATDARPRRPTTP